MRVGFGCLLCLGGGLKLPLGNEIGGMLFRVAVAVLVVAVLGLIFSLLIMNLFYLFIHFVI